MRLRPEIRYVFCQGGRCLFTLCRRETAMTILRLSTLQHRRCGRAAKASIISFGDGVKPIKVAPPVKNSIGEYDRE